MLDISKLPAAMGNVVRLPTATAATPPQDDWHLSNNPANKWFPSLSPAEQLAELLLMLPALRECHAHGRGTNPHEGGPDFLSVTLALARAVEVECGWAAGSPEQQQVFHAWDAERQKHLPAALGVYEPERLRAMWQSAAARPEGLGLGSLVRWAREDGYLPPHEREQAAAVAAAGEPPAVARESEEAMAVWQCVAGRMKLQLRTNTFTGMRQVCPAGSSEWSAIDDAFWVLLVLLVRQYHPVRMTNGRARILTERQARQAGEALFNACPYEPVLAWLTVCRAARLAEVAACEASGRQPPQRLDTLLTRYFGAEDSRYTRAVGRSVLLALVARQFGETKWDAALILEGPQGVGKSQGLAALVPDPDWFTDSYDMGGDAKLTLEKTGGKLICESAELVGFGKRESEHIKANLSATRDKARMAYGTTTTERHRRFIIVGSTNADQYLKDGTGNRRFLPVAVGEVALAKLAQVRDRLIGEVVLELERLCKGNTGVRALRDAAVQLPRDVWALAEAEQAARLDDTLAVRLRGVLDEWLARQGGTRPAHYWVLTSDLMAGLGGNNSRHGGMQGLSDAMRLLGGVPEQRRMLQGDGAAEAPRRRGFVFGNSSGTEATPVLVRPTVFV